jgi:hypothetical protein
MFAIKFLNEISLSTFLEMCHRTNLHYLDRTLPQKIYTESGETAIVDYDDNALKEFFLTILQRDGFEKFITRIEGWLRCYRRKLETYYSSQGQGQTEQEESTYEQDDVLETAEYFV